MNQSEPNTFSNRLLRRMTPDDLALIKPHLGRDDLPQKRSLFEADKPIEKVWFLESGIGSIVTVSPEGLRAENGLFGRDGFAPVQALGGISRAPFSGVMQVEGNGYSLDAHVLHEAAENSISLMRLLQRYAQVLAAQTAYTALTNAVHQIHERLARWILMCHDRVDGDELPLTHEFLSIMLGVRRPSVTMALHALEGNRLIGSERGCIIVRDRKGLEDFAADNYGMPEREYEDLIGPL